MADIIFVSIALYLLYRLIFDLLVPIYRTTTQIKQKFRNFHQDAARGDQAHAYRKPSSSGDHSSESKKKSGLGEYIEFEDVK